MAWQNALQFLPVLLCFYFLLPSLLCDNLLCYYSPLLEKEKKFDLIVTECPPNERCFKAVGRYGNYTVLTFRGCLVEGDCGKLNNIRFKGMLLNVSYSCCDWLYCNSCLTVEPPYVTAMLVAVAVMVWNL
ncbi:protein Bouncer-like [Cololabis saira]|uniref:protein Bouncer-like n=1 Tax=Cololabis saira TaxID=129043 RepID=UPI002AD569AB|nr:protein Bouncer-like [Cololabis saira]